MIHPLIEPRYAALDPFMSATTLSFHHGKHLRNYLDQVNRMVADGPLSDRPLKQLCKELAEGTPLLNNAAQAWNHQFFFNQFTNTHTSIPSRTFQRLTASFGSMEAFKEAFSNAALALFGSGWVWLSADAQGLLHITQEANAGNPLRKDESPILCIDVWEHAYYLDHQNRRADFVKAFWNVIDWEIVQRRLDGQEQSAIYF